MTECPECGMDVRGFDERTNDDGLRSWTAPIRVDLANSGRPTYSGGLTHHEGGKRCHR